MGVDLISWAQAAAREATLVAAIGILLGSIDDLIVDSIYGYRWLRRRLAGKRDRTLADIAPATGRIAILVGAWDETGVIGKMIRAARARFGDRDFRLYVGTYPNDRATFAEARAAAEGDRRIRIIIGRVPGPTSKADNLNCLWRALLADEAIEGPVTGVVLHDAEDVVHPRELDVYADYLRRYDAVQLPVMPLVDPGSSLVAGHYVDEFTEESASAIYARPKSGRLGGGHPSRKLPVSSRPNCRRSSSLSWCPIADVRKVCEA